MSEPNCVPPVSDQLSLILHTAVDYGRNEGIGIGIIQRATATGIAQASTLPVKEQKHGVERGQVRAKNVKTPERAHMFAIILAMGLARSTIKRQNTTARIKMQSVTVLCSMPVVAELIKYHRAHGPKGLEEVVSTEDRSMLKRVMASVKRLSRYNVQVLVLGNGADGDTIDASRVKMIAWQRKKKACRRRRHARRIMSKTIGMTGDEEED